MGSLIDVQDEKKRSSWHVLGLSHEGRAGSVQYLAAGQHLWGWGPIWVDPMSPHSVDGKLRRRIPQGARLCSVRRGVHGKETKQALGWGLGLQHGLCSLCSHWQPLRRSTVRSGGQMILTACSAFPFLDKK